MGDLVQEIKEFFGYSASNETLSSVDIVVPLERGAESTLTYLGDEGLGEIIEVPNNVLDSYQNTNRLDPSSMGASAIEKFQYNALQVGLGHITHQLVDAGYNPEALYNAPAEEAHNILETLDIIPMLSQAAQDANHGLVTEEYDPNNSEHVASIEGMQRRALEIGAAYEAAQLALGLPGYSSDMAALVEASPDLSPAAKASVEQAMSGESPKFADPAALPAYRPFSNP
jgi:hypothetical protein